ncbi:MAG: carboxypeptidase regulatory-like domain-containing protein [Holophagales bacterium]|nr:carboxypeptidase regulatory-like domain-containing protein [Holophagales bacterium]
MTPRIRSLNTILWVLLLGISSFALAQDYRGTIKGRIVDNSGGELPGVSVTVTNVETNVSANAMTDAKGFYRVPYLNAGKYDVTAKLTGLQPTARKGISVNVGSVLTVDLIMTIGVSSEIVVTGGAPLLDQTSPVTGQVVTREQIKELPLADGTAYMLSRIAPGISEASDLHFSRPGDNANLGGVVANGVRGGNDFTLDGAPNIVSDRRVGFSPPSEAISEFKVETNAFDAQSGHTAGAVINLALRSGTNQFHGAASYFNRSSDRTAKSPFQHKQGQDVISRDYDRFAAMIAGPVVKDSTFFMVAYEKLEDLTGEPATYTVPTEKMRKGDFSELLGLGIKIYDPLTGTSNRTAFAGNIIPTNRLNPIALALLKYYPMPNQAGKSDQSNNYYSPQDRTYDYNSVIGRIDQSLSGGHQLFLNGYWNQRLEDRYNWAGVVEDFAVTQGVDTRDNFGTTLGYTGTFSSSLIGDVRLSYSKFGERRSPSQDFDPASLGFDAATVELFRGYDYLPRFDIAGMATLGAQRSDYTRGFNRPFYNYGAAPSVTWLLKDHTVRAGYDFRYQKWWRTDDGYLGGRYNFTGAYTRANNSATIQAGQALAQFLLGLPTSGGNSLIDWNTYGDYSQINNALYVNDEWRVGKKLTINAGLRLEIDNGLTEANDWNIYGFDLTSSNPVEAAAKAAYAKNPIPEIPVGEFAVRGGLLYGQGATWDTLTKLLPRLGASYVLTDKTVVRGGIGLFSFPYFFDNINQTGFSQSTLLVSTENNGGTFIADLNNPFPNGLTSPTGSSLGLATFNGRDLVSTTASIMQQDRESPTYTRWSAGVMQDLGKGWRLDAAYVGSEGRNLAVRRDINYIPREYLSTSASRDAAVETYLSTNVPNPYKGLLPGTSFNGSTIQRRQLLRPYSEFGRVAVEEYTGTDSYNAMQLSVQKSFKDGSSVLATYTWSKLMDELAYVDPTDAAPSKRLSPDDRPHRATLAGIFKLPFGKGRKWGSNWSGILDAVLGGWQLTAAYQYQVGQPVVWSNNLYFDPNCSPEDVKTDFSNKDGQIGGFDRPAWNTSCFYFPDAQGLISDPRIAVSDANIRTFPTVIDSARYPDLHLLDFGISKTFVLYQDVTLQVRAEAINALNYTVWWNPDINPRSATFGYFREQRNNPRDWQLGARLSF